MKTNLPPSEGNSTPESLSSPPRNAKSARSLLTRLILGGTVVAVGLGSYFSYQTARNATLENLKQNTLSKVQHGTDEIDSWLRTLKARVEMFANTDALRSLDWSIAGPYLRAEEARLEDFSAIALSQSNGWRNVTVPNVEPVNMSDRRWFQAAMAGQIFVNDPLISRATGLPVIAISAPIRKDTQPDSPVAGVVHGVVDVDWIQHVVGHLKYGEGSYTFALNSEGEAIIHPNPALMSTLEKPAPSLLNSPQPGLAKIARKMVEGQQGVELVQLDGGKFYIAFLPLQQANWSMELSRSCPPRKSSARCWS